MKKSTGEGISGLHNVSLSPANPGCVWLTLQFSNTVVLVDAETMATRKVLRVPTIYTKPDGSVLRLAWVLIGMGGARTGITVYREG